MQHTLCINKIYLYLENFKTQNEISYRFDKNITVWLVHQCLRDELVCDDLFFWLTKSIKINKSSYFVNLFLLVVFTDTNRSILIFISLFHDRNEFEGGFASVKLTTENGGEAALTQWCCKIEWETDSHFITSQRVETFRTSTVETGTREIARKIFIIINLLSEASSLK